MIGIYKITSPTGRIYIGQSIDINRRFYTYKRYDCKTSTKLHRSLLKHGAENHSFEVIEECEICQLNEKERYYQELFNCVKQGLNCNFVKTDTRSGKVSEETRLKMVKAQTGNKKWLGKKHTDETKTKISIANTGKKRTKEFGLAISLRKKGKPTGLISPNTRIVLDVINGIYYDSLKEASK